MTHSVLLAVLALALLTVVPGPDMAVVTSSALAGGRQAAARTAAGVVVGLLLWGSLAVAGLAAVLVASAEAYTVVRTAGAVYLVLLGLHTCWRGRHSPAPPAVPAGPARNTGWRTGLLTNQPVLNRPRVRRWLDRVTGTVLIGFGLRPATVSR